MLILFCINFGTLAEQFLPLISTFQSMTIRTLKRIRIRSNFSKAANSKLSVDVENTLVLPLKFLDWL